MPLWEIAQAIEAAHATRVLPLTLAERVSDTLALPAAGSENRMKKTVRLLRREDGLRMGDLGIKNLMEACAAQRLVIFTAGELADLPNGSGALVFWTHTGLTRAATTEEVRASVEATKSVQVL